MPQLHNIKDKKGPVKLHNQTQLRQQSRLIKCHNCTIPGKSQSQTHNVAAKRKPLTHYISKRSK
jgi:hypothetical protein